MAQRVPKLLFYAGLVLLALLPHLAAPPAPAWAAEAGGDELFALTAPGQGQGQNVVYVVDPRSLRMAVYEHRAAGGALELVAVRNMEFDLEFEQYPTRGGRAPDFTVDEARKAAGK